MDELISRAEVMKHMHFRRNEKDEIEGYVRTADILSMPSAELYTEAEIQKMQELEQAELQTAYEQGKKDAQPERKGKWIRHTRVEPVYSIDGVETWGIKCQCNKCCFATTVVEDFGYYNFCPNCGADMRGES